MTTKPPKKRSSQSAALIPIERVERRILLVRNQKVILDADLASLCGVPTKRLNQQVKRSSERFPVDFMFQLTKDEFADLKSQSATSSWGGRRTAPYAFTEHGALMAANVLTPETAIKMCILIVRAFLQLREVLAWHEGLSQKLAEMEAKYDHQFQVVFDAIRQLLEPPEAPPKRRIGYASHGDDDE